MEDRQRKKDQLTVLNIRENNKRNILAQFMDTAELMRNDLAKESGLSLMTVKHIVDELIQAAIIEEHTSEASVGRKPKALRLSSKYGNIVCVNLTSTESISYIIYDISRQLLKQNTLYFQSKAQGCRDRLSEVIEEIKAQLKVIRTVTIGLAVCVPSAYYEAEDMVNDDLIPEFKDFHIRSFLREQFQLDNIMILHDVFAAGQSEYESSVPVPESQFYLYCGCGVGGCMIIRGTAVQGEDLLAGEVGKILTANPFCGEYQTLEEIASIPAILRKVHEKVPQISFEEVLKEYREDRKEIVEILDKVLETQARVLYNLVWCYNPERFIVDSCCGEYSSLIKEKAEAFMDCIQKEEIHATVKVEVARYDEFHRMRGCFLMVRERWLDTLAGAAAAQADGGKLIQ